MIKYDTYIAGFLLLICFVWLYGAPTELRPNGAETVKMIYFYLGYYKLKETLEVKTTSPAGTNRCLDVNNLNIYDNAGINSDCNAYSPVLKGNPSATRENIASYKMYI